MRNSNSRSDESRGFGDNPLPPVGSLRSTAARASRARQRGLLCCAFAATVIPLPALADDYYFQPDSGLSPWNWYSGTSPYFSWRNSTLGSNANLPPNIASAYLIQSGVLGASNATVLFNHTYAGPGLASLQIDSNNALMQTDPSSAMIVSSTESIGYFGSGSYTQSGGANTAGIWVDVGVFGGAIGAYNQSGGSLTTASLYVGDIGIGTFNQSGAAVTSVNGVAAGNGLYVGYNTAGNGTYILGDSATLTAATTEYIGYNGTGVFNQSGGINTVLNNRATANSGKLIVGFGSASNGSYNQSGGTVDVSTGELRLGTLPGSSGTYTLGGGTLATFDESIGSAGRGTFIQTGGTHSNTDSLSVGVGALGIGTYSMTGGTLALNNAVETIGFLGIGTFNQSGGINSISGKTLYIGVFRTGTYSMSDGTLALTNNANEIIGPESGSAGTFNQSGGNHTIDGTLFVTTLTAGSSGVFNLSGGSLSARTVQLNAGGTFNQTGGTLSATTFNMAGGTVTGTLQNQGTFNYGGGTFAGRLLNQGVVNLGPSFTAANGLENDTTIVISTGSTVTLQGQGLDNEGTLTLAGGSLIVSTSSTNLNGGTFNLAPSIPFSLNGAMSNTGVINLNGSTLNGAGVLTNAVGGTIAGYGTLGSNFPANLGTLAVQGGQMVVPTPFANSGSIVVSSKAQVSVNLILCCFASSIPSS